MSTFAEEVQEISLDGFKVVGGEMFRAPMRPSMPTVTIWKEKMAFSKASVFMLNRCERIRVSVNVNTKCILVTPVTAKDADGIKWIKVNTPGTKNADQITRQITCPEFTTGLYKVWDFNMDCVYPDYNF